MTASSEISASDTSVIKLFNYCDEHLNEPTMYTVGNSGNKNSAYRIYFKFSKPQLPLTARIKKAEIALTQVYSGSDCKEKPLLGLFTAKNNNMNAGSYIPNDSSELLDYERIKEYIESEECTETVKYKFDITKAFDAFNNGEIESLGLVLKLLEENRSVNDVVVFEGIEKGYDKMPKLNITYESAYGNKNSYKSHTHTLGRLGTASIDLNLGNLSLESEDFAWNGNRMPVTINHFYNSALSNKKYSFDESIGLNIADFGDMNLGLGFRLNLMQSIKYLKNALGVIEYTEEEKNNNFLTKDGYIFTNESGEEVYLKNTGQSACMYPEDCKCYNIYKEINNGEITYNAYTKTLTSGDEDYIFDSKGRLVKIASGRNEKTITYNSFNQISTVTDGVGREFLFTYDENGFLTKITAPDNTEFYIIIPIII